MKQNETKQKERYEAPVALDISPVTVNGSASDPTSTFDNIQDPENPNDHP